MYATGSAAASITFNGSAIAIVSRKTPSAGIAQVELDGQTVGEFDMYSPSNVYQHVMWRADGLSSGPHVVRLAWTAGRNPAVTTTATSIVLDAFVVFDRDAVVPQNLVGVAAADHARISWTPAAGFAAQAFNIFRRSEGQDWGSIGSVGGNETGFVDTSPQIGLSYEYAVTARDGWGHESQLSSSIPLAVGSAAGVGTYEEDDPQLAFSGHWTRTSHTRDSAGASSYATTTGSSVSLTFQGPAVSFVGRRTPSSGFADITIDGVRVASVDRYSPTTEHQQVIWSTSSLSAGQHTIRVDWSPQRNPAVSVNPSLSFDSFVVPSTQKPPAPQELEVNPVEGRAKLTWTKSSSPNIGAYRVYKTDTVNSQLIAELPADATVYTDGPPLVGETVHYAVAAVDVFGNESARTSDVAFVLGLPAKVGTYQEDAAQVRLTGGWVRTAHSADSGGASVYALADAVASFMFDGSSVRWVSRTGPKSGKAEIYIDGTLQAVVDRYSPANTYQQVVWETTSLPAGLHRMDVVWTSSRNPLSSGSSVVIDAIVVPPSTVPPTPTGLAAQPYQSGVRVSWDKPASTRTTHFLVYRDAVLIAELDAAQTSYDDLGLPIGSAHRYRVVGLDRYRLESNAAVSSPVQVEGNLPPIIRRIEDCPASTTRVASADQLKVALAAARPGSVIALAPGSYEGSFSISASGDPSDPIWICGSTESVIRPGTLTRGTGLYISGSHIVIAGLAVQQSLKGIMVVGADDVTLADLTITDIGDEAVHFRNSTTDSILVGSTISRTGLTNAGYGEGVYVGTSSGNWCLYNACAVDRSDRVSILWNEISETSAEAIEVKEGVRASVVVGNTVHASGATPSGVSSAIQFKGNTATAMSNVVVTDRAYAFRVLYTSGGWGAWNVLAGNRAEMGTGGLMFYLATRDNVIKCDNVSVPSGSFGATCIQ